jgi:hypothetical protein
MSTETEKQERGKEIKLLLARWLKGQRSKQTKLPFLKAKTVFLHHSGNSSKKIS